MGGVVEVEIASLVSGLDALQKAGKDLRPVFKKLRPAIAADLREHFSSAEAPEGAWAPRASSSIKKILARRREGWHRKTLAGGAVSRYLKGRSAYKKNGQVRTSFARRLTNQLGALKSAWLFRVTGSMFEARSRLAWAGMQQGGGIVGHGARLPARTFAWFSDAVLDRFGELAITYLLKSWAAEELG
jgi:hypothetical protein